MLQKHVARSVSLHGHIGWEWGLMYCTISLRNPCVRRFEIVPIYVVKDCRILQHICLQNLASGGQARVYPAFLPSFARDQSRIFVLTRDLALRHLEFEIRLLTGQNSLTRYEILQRPFWMNTSALIGRELSPRPISGRSD